MDSLVNHTGMRTMLYGVDDLIFVILCNPQIDIQSLHGFIESQCTIGLNLSWEREGQGLAEL